MFLNISQHPGFYCVASSHVKNCHRHNTQRPSGNGQNVGDVADFYRRYFRQQSRCDSDAALLTLIHHERWVHNYIDSLQLSSPTRCRSALLGTCLRPKSLVVGHRNSLVERYKLKNVYCTEKLDHLDNIMYHSYLISYFSR